jgi:hypothetical protein
MTIIQNILSDKRQLIRNNNFEKLVSLIDLRNCSYKYSNLKLAEATMGRGLGSSEEVR